MEEAEASDAPDRANGKITLRDVDALIERGEYAVARLALAAAVAAGRIPEAEAAGRSRRIDAFAAPDPVPAALPSPGVSGSPAVASQRGADAPYLASPLRLAFLAAGVFFALRALFAVPMFVDALRHQGGLNTPVIERRRSIFDHGPPSAALDRTTVGAVIGEDMLRFGPASWACFAAAILGKRQRRSNATGGQ